MSLFVRVNTTFYTHIKTIKLRAKIGNDAFWVPPRIWSVAAEQRPDGIFEGVSAEEFALLLGYVGDANRMLEALLQAGFMDSEPLRIHNWQKHNGYHSTFAERASKAAKARWGKVREEDKKREEKTREETSIASSMPQAFSLLASEPDITEEDQSVDEIYALYPRKEQPREAKRAIRKAIRTHGPLLVREKTAAYARMVCTAIPNKADRVFIPYPASWFNAESFLADPSDWEVGLRRYQPVVPVNPRNNGVTTDIAKQSNLIALAAARSGEKALAEARANEGRTGK